MRKRSLNMLSAFIAIIALIALAPPPAAAMLTVKANHDQIDIDYNYHGSTVSVKGYSDPRTDIVIKVRSEDSDQKLMRKDKVAGILWMNVEALHFSRLPDVYLLKSTRPLDQILNADQEISHGIGYDALGYGAEIAPDRGEEQKRSWFDQFVRYKESKNLFRQSVGEIELAEGSDGQSYAAEFKWPFEAPPGEYDVEVDAVRDGSVVETAHTRVEVQQTGAVKVLSGMALNRAALYGVLSILIALAAGFGVGAVFGKGGGAH